MPLSLGKWSRSAREKTGRLALAVTLGFGLVTGVATSALPASVVALDVSTGTAVISGSGNGVHLRASAGFGAEVLTVVPEGATVELMIDTYDTVLDPDGSTRWWPVAYQGAPGWVSGYYLSSATASNVPTNVTGTTVSDTWSSEEGVPTFDGGADPSGATARVADPEGLNVRSEPELDAPVLGVAAAGEAVVLRTNEINIVYDMDDRAWWPIDYFGQLGWVVGAYLTNGADESAGTAPAADPTTTFAPGQYVMVRTGSGQGVNIRAEPTVEASRVGFALDGTVIQVMDGPHGFDASTIGWYLVTDGTVTGFVDGDMLAVAEQLPAPENAPSDPAPQQDPARFGAGQIAQVATGDGDPLNLRTDATLDSSVIAELPEQTPVEILNGPVYDAQGAGWYLVSTGDAQGYLSGRFLVESSLTALPQSQPAPSVAPAVPTVAAEPSVAPAPTTVTLPTSTPTQQPVEPAPGPATGTFIYPTTGKISQNFGCSPFPYYPVDSNLGCSFHNGLDIATQAYTPIVAADGGTVVFAGWCDCGLGYYVKIDHGNGYVTTYGHMAEMPYVRTGDVVGQGDVIGPLGSTGFSTGPHVHFGVELNGSTIDPLTVLG